MLEKSYQEIQFRFQRSNSCCRCGSEGEEWQDDHCIDWQVGSDYAKTLEDGDWVNVRGWLTCIVVPLEMTCQLGTRAECPFGGRNGSEEKTRNLDTSQMDQCELLWTDRSGGHGLMCGRRQSSDHRCQVYIWYGRRLMVCQCLHWFLIMCYALAT